MEFDEFCGLTTQSVNDLREFAPLEMMRLDAPPPAAGILNVGATTRHVDDLPIPRRFQVQWCHDRRTGLGSTAMKRAEPSRTNEDVVLEKDHVRCVHVGEADVAELSGRHELAKLDEPK